MDAVDSILQAQGFVLPPTVLLHHQAHTQDSGDAHGVELVTANFLHLQRLSESHVIDEGKRGDNSAPYYRTQLHTFLDDVPSEEGKVLIITVVSVTPFFTHGFKKIISNI